MLVKVALQPQKRFANHARLLGVVLDAFDQHPGRFVGGEHSLVWQWNKHLNVVYHSRVVELGDLLEVAENHFLVVRHNLRRLRVVQHFDVVLDHQQQIATELFLGLNQFADNGSTYFTNRLVQTDSRTTAISTYSRR